MRLFVLALVSFASLNAVELPSEIRSYFDKKHPGWALARVAPQIDAWFKEYKFPYAPNLLVGDFDGDGKRDYAVRVQSGGKDVTVAFVDRGTGKFDAFPLSTDEADPFTFLLLYEKGSKDFDFT